MKSISYLYFLCVVALLFASVQESSSLSLEISEIRTRISAFKADILAAIDDKAVDLAKRRGGSSGGSKGGSSSSSSSGSKGGSSSSSSSSSGSKGGSSSSSGSSSSAKGSSASTSSSRYLPGGRYGGGASTAFVAGAATVLGLTAILVLASALTSHYPGYWGNNGVYTYSYNTTLNGTDYDVNCYCIRYNPCSCEKVENITYFDTLPSNVSRFDVTSNVTYVYINGTLDNSTSTTSGDSSSTVSGSNGGHEKAGSSALVALSIAAFASLLL